MNTAAKNARIPEHSKKLPNGAYSHNIPIPPDLKGREVWDYLAELIKSKKTLRTSTHLRTIFREAINADELEEEKLTFELSGIVFPTYPLNHPQS
ncbi:hypothetical protein [Larkinella rosea]|uniref:Uncharacterized protein n=1 Tax=Larkinella rosea TaxID=2025312 RepID=A0A3P1C0H8_9BACT|nr:hypothetical protein [Larkinella rosea]RRB06294.1 hypothetical protein EHT25_00365 [Larkinella rosea]